MTTPLQTQIDDHTRRLETLETGLAELRQLVGAQREPATKPARREAFPAVRIPPPPDVPPATEVPAVEPAPELEWNAPRHRRPSVELADLFGAKALAIAGGVVTLLGIVFFFVLAVNRGWIGPVGRVGLGAGASFFVFIAGLELRRRFGETHAALAAVGAGIAGAYATLLAAAAIYDLVPGSVALAGAALIAAVGVLTSLRWNSPLIAGLGLIGALLSPLAAAAQEGVAPLGTSFAALIFAATAAVALAKRWPRLLVAGAVGGAPQLALLVLQPRYDGDGTVSVMLIAAAFALIGLAAGILHHFRSGEQGLGSLTTSFVFGAGIVAVSSALRLFATPESEGLALLVITLVYAAGSAVFFVRGSGRDMSALLAAAAFTVGALSAADLFSGQPLAYFWAAEAAALTWLARRTRELRFQLWSTAYLGLASLHALVFDAPPSRLVLELGHPSAGAGALLACAAAAVAVGHGARPWDNRVERTGGIVNGLLAAVARRQAALRHGCGWWALLLLTEAVSLGVLELSASRQDAYVALAALWSLIGFGLVSAGLRTRTTELVAGGLAWLVAETVLTVLVQGLAADPAPRGWSFLILACAGLATAVTYQVAVQRRGWAGPVPVVGIAASVLLAVGANDSLLAGKAGGAGLLAIALVYGLIATILFARRSERDFTTILWSVAVALAVVAAPRLVHGMPLVAVWSLFGVALAWIARLSSERRLFAAAGSTLTLAAGLAVGSEAPPMHLFLAGAAHGGGAVILLVAAALAAMTWLLPKETELMARARLIYTAAAGVLGVYGISLAIVALVGRAFPEASSAAGFHAAHVAVSAFWGLLALGLLYAGLTRWRSLRTAGLALFALTLAKVFLFDLSSLSSITRAFSFVAVGAVLMLGGFFYQRLSTPALIEQ